ncbi:MAG: TadE/TadG family type IV pilus assembly protein [Planctomycetota bacterium]
MHRQIILGVWPYLALMVLSSALCWLLLRMTRVRPDWRQLKQLAGDERGAVQSLSFVLTIPVFVIVMMFIVQLSQITIGKFVVEYAAFAAVRSAQVWLPAHVSDEESTNRVTSLCYRETMTGDDGWQYDCYEVDPVGPKYNKIRFAAVQACLAICPSRDVGADASAVGNDAAGSLVKALGIWSPQLLANPKVAERIKNKLAYSLANTLVRIDVRHRHSEPPLMTYLIPPYEDEFLPGEIGWNDQILVTVTHRFALLPGPGRLLARQSQAPSSSGSGGSSSGGSGSSGGGSGSGSTGTRSSTSTTGSGTTPAVDSTASRIQLVGGVHTYALTATAMLHTEGEKSMLGYRQNLLGPSPVVSGLAAGGFSQSDETTAAFESLQAPARAQRLLAAEAAQDCCDQEWERELSAATERMWEEVVGPAWPSILKGAQR